MRLTQKQSSFIEYSGFLDGQLSPLHKLNPAQFFKSLSFLGQSLTRYKAQDFWEIDTKRLPSSLAKHRRLARHFAQQHLTPNIELFDNLAHQKVGHLHPAAQELLSQAGKAGLMTNMLPAPFGSAAVTDLRFAKAYKSIIQIEELATVCAGQMLLLSAHQLGIAPIALSGDLKAMWRFLKPMSEDFLQGKPHLFAYAITEPAAGSDVEDGFGATHNKPRVIAKPYGDGYVLNGTKCFISGGDIAQKITVFAALENKGFESWTAFVVDANNIGLKAIHTELKMGMRASTAAELCFSDAYVAKEDIVGGLEQGWALNRSTLNASRYPVAAMGVGLARRACELALDFCCRTTLANKPLIAYQDIQLQIAQMIAQTRAMRSLLWQQAHSMQPIQSEASMSKFYITDKAQEVCEMAMMIMGEHAVSTSCGIEKLLRDVRLTRFFEGTNQINRLSVIEDMQPFLLDKINGRNVHISV